MPTTIWNRIRGVSTVNRADLDTGFRALGVRPGDHIVVHTALSSFGRVDGGPNALIAALLNVMGPNGTIMVPTATWRSCYLRAPDGPLPDGVVGYDPATTPCDADMGRVPEALRHWPGARRSPHPLMSVAAVGALAQVLTEAHPADDPLRPYRTLAAQGGRVLLLGVDHTRNTTVHAAEFIAGLPHLSGPGHALLRDRSAPGGSRVLTMPREPDCSLGFDALNDRVPRREQQIGGCIAWLLEGRALLDTALDMLRADPATLLCDHPSCRTCTRGRWMYADLGSR
ncbi:MAG: aminoglycoside N(3)-acetyltransferase [Chloroflexia bacterium]